MKRTSASILLGLIEPFKKPVANLTVKNHWAMSFKLQGLITDQVAPVQMTKGLIKLDSIVRRFNADMVTASVSLNSYVSIVKKLDRAVEFSLTNPSALASDLSKDLTSEIFGSLELCQALLEAKNFYQEVDEEEVKNCGVLIEELIELLSNSGIEDITKKTIIRRVKDLKEALNSFQIFGDTDVFKEAYFYQAYKESLDSLLIDPTLINRFQDLYGRIFKTSKPVSDAITIGRNLYLTYEAGRTVIERITQ